MTSKPTSRLGKEDHVLEVVCGDELTARTMPTGSRRHSCGGWPSLLDLIGGLAAPAQLTPMPQITDMDDVGIG
ncbi:hypothetical protein FXF50_00455 [Micromonospora sp. AP08]|uniref:hypothetical protein n=1 Tax=Micromonospora sp. AP08 TaxID=2604467 RepID=UPI0011D33F4B|nr:hypothetical protein [Micromonospora sp. AP08]TYB40250.1 hypothetical protein FXF50_00455 [Micromonospora sp. AP08]